MGFSEQDRTPSVVAEKINVPESEKANIKFELDHIEEILNGLEDRDESYAYADTADSMGVLDDMLMGHLSYEKLLTERREASRLCMQGDENEKKEGLGWVKAWVKKVRELL